MLDDERQAAGRSLHRVAAVVGIGHTDWPGDYRRVRAGEKPFDGYGYGAMALRAALDDAGLAASDVDGLIVGPYNAYERMGEVLGLNPRWGDQADAVTAVLKACMAIRSGLAEVVALVYGNDQRSAAVQYGGTQAMGGDAFLGYVYHTPWGLTSQGALYALATRRYMAQTGMTERDLGEVAVAERAWAALNPNAIMRKTLTIDDYLASAMIADPLRLLDYCLVNDGGVALIVTEASRARRMAGTPVFIDGVGRADLNRDATNLGSRVVDFYRSAQRLASRQVYDMAGLGPADIDALLVYDSFSCHVPFALDGFGYCAEGEAKSLLRAGTIGPGGRLPVNTGGGHLSESYMQGWNHQVEAVRQLRGGLGPRQVPDCRHVHYVSDVAGKVTTIIYGV